MRNEEPRSGLQGLHLFLLVGLLVPPALAIYRGFGPSVASWAGGWVAAVSGFAYLMYAWDKQQARDKQWREPESLLHLVELAGGWPGAFVAQRRLRHKTVKVGYQFVFWLIVIGYEVVAVDWLLGWPLWHALRTAIL